MRWRMRRNFNSLAPQLVSTNAGYTFFQIHPQSLYSIRFAMFHNVSFTLKKCKKCDVGMVHFDNLRTEKDRNTSSICPFLKRTDHVIWHERCVIDSASDAGCDRQVSAD